MTNADIIRSLIGRTPSGRTVDVPAVIRDAAPLLAGKSADNPRAAVSQVLLQMVRDGSLYRRSWGTYVRTDPETPAADLAPDASDLAEKYLRDNERVIGYVSGQGAGRAYGLTEEAAGIEIATNRYSSYVPVEERRCGISLKNPRIPVDGSNAAYLQALDALDFGLEGPLRDLERRDELALRWLAETRKRKLDPGKLIGYASRCYSKRLVVGLGWVSESLLDEPKA